MLGAARSHWRLQVGWPRALADRRRGGGGGGGGGGRREKAPPVQGGLAVGAEDVGDEGLAAGGVGTSGYGNRIGGDCLQRLGNVDELQLRADLRRRVGAVHDGGIGL